MRIALTYDLRQYYLDLGFNEEETAEFDSRETIYALSGTLVELGHRVEQVGSIFELTKRLAAGERWDLAFNICEGLYGRSREAQVPALLEAYAIDYTFSDPLTMAVSLDKPYAKAIVAAAGVPTARGVVVSSASDLVAAAKLRMPLFVKPASEGTGKGISGDSVVRDMKTLEVRSLELIERYNQAVLVEEFLPGREFTVGILGTGDDARVAGVVEITLHDEAEPLAYSYVNKERCEELVTYGRVTDKAIIAEASSVALAAHRALECRDASRVDIRADASGRLCFIEMNPLPGLHPTHSDLPILCTKAGISYRELISEIVRSASKRRQMGRQRHFPLASTPNQETKCG